MRRVIYLLFSLCFLILYPAVSALAEVHTVIVLSQGDHTIYDIDPATGQVVNKVQVGGMPTDAVFSWDERSLFVSVPDAGYVSIINLPTFKETSRLTKSEFKRSAGAGTFLDGLATTPDGRKLYVAVADGLMVFDQHLLVYNPEYPQPENKITLHGKDGQHMLVQGPTNKLYYPFGRENQVVVIDTERDVVVKTVQVKGGPTDVMFCIGGEAWVTAADGSISIIDTDKDEVVRTIQTGGKGTGRITVAPDIRYIAASHSDSGDTTILQPLTKEIVGEVKTEKGSVSVAFAPAAKSHQCCGDLQLKDPTNRLYVTSPSEVAVVDLTNMSVSAHWKVGQGVTDELIHYKYPDGFTPPREGTAKRVLETDLFTVYENAMFLYDVSPIHEHRTDMVGVFTGTGVAKLGCWDPKCPPDMIPVGDGGLPYSNGEGEANNPVWVSRGTIHQEEGGSPSPRRMIMFMMKPNYYQQTNPRKVSLFADTGFQKLTDNPRAWEWSVILVPGKPVQFPAGNYAIVYLSGGLMRVTHNGVPEIVNKYFNDWEWDPTAKTIEALSNRIRIAVVEFK